MNAGALQIAREYQRIDRIRSTAKMRAELLALPLELRKDVIIVGLYRSSAQFTWSWLAKVTLDILT